MPSTSISYPKVKIYLKHITENIRKQFLGIKVLIAINSDPYSGPCCTASNAGYLLLYTIQSFI
jgi:hypothetical protein